MLPSSRPARIVKKIKKYNQSINYPTVLWVRDIIPDPDFYPSRIPDPTTATTAEKKISCPTFL
jgi:hypothetical protein